MDIKEAINSLATNKKDGGSSMVGLGLLAAGIELARGAAGIQDQVSMIVQGILALALMVCGYFSMRLYISKK